MTASGHTARGLCRTGLELGSPDHGPGTRSSDPCLEAAFCSAALGQETSEAARTFWICFHFYAVALLLMDSKKKKKNLKRSLDQEDLFPSDLVEKETETERLSVLPKVTRQLESGKAGTGTLFGPQCSYA